MLCHRAVYRAIAPRYVHYAPPGVVGGLSAGKEQDMEFALFTQRLSSNMLGFRTLRAEQ